jgi:magnesium transporter
MRRSATDGVKAIARRLPVTRKRRPSAATLRPPGSAPGTLVTDPDALKPAIRLFAYGPESLDERSNVTVSDVRQALGKQPVTWIDVAGLGDVGTIGELGEIFGLHRLALEDVLNPRQRAKIEQYGSVTFVVLHEVAFGEALATDQLSLFVGDGFVLTFQEKVGDCFDPVRDRIRKASGRIRLSGPDYLAYALIDAVVDSYFPVLETYGDRLAAIEDEIIAGWEKGAKDTVARLHQNRRDLLTLRRALWPVGDALNVALRGECVAFTHETRIYLRDCQDHVNRILDLVQTYRELGADLFHVSLSSVNNRMNEVMKVLTVITSIFIPLSFIAGVYGMNFDPDTSPWNMPELRWVFGYPAALALMAGVALVLLAIFKKRNWF